MMRFHERSTVRAIDRSGALEKIVGSSHIAARTRGSLLRIRHNLTPKQDFRFFCRSAESKYFSRKVQPLIRLSIAQAFLPKP